MSSKVYFSDFQCKVGDSRLNKMERLIKKAGIDQIDFKDKYVAVKIHFGEWGNLAFLRQQYAKTVCDYVKSKGGIPFLTDSNTLYAGMRHNAIDHLDAAYMNGYNPLATGVHTIIADGLRGLDERIIPVEGGEYVKEAKIAAAIADADIIISITHVKAHASAGFGGVIKNLGMGSGSKKGKMEMHASGAPQVYPENCVGCGLCAEHCLNGSITLVDKKAVIDTEKCLGCGHCLSFCFKQAIECPWDEAKPVMNKKIAEYAKAAVTGKPTFHISFVCDVSPDCDCIGSNDIPLVPDVGMFAGFDPVALDQACVDAVNAQHIIKKGKLLKRLQKISPEIPDTLDDVFGTLNPISNLEAGLIHAEKLGMGTREYELETVK